jgi:hypothetical protein
VKIDPLLSNEIQLNSICSKIEIIPLENIKGGFLTTPMKLIILDDNYYILDRKQHTIFCFDNTGKLIHNSSNLNGPGPNEYLSIVDFDYCTINDCIAILDARGQKILFTDINLNHQYSLYFDRSLLPIAYFVYAADSVFIFKGLRKQYLTYFNFASGEMNNIILPESTGHRFFLSKMHPFIPSNKSLYFSHNDASNEIFEVDVDNLILNSYLTVDFGKFNLEPSSIKHDSYTEFMDISGSKYALLQSFRETDQYYIIHFLYNNMYHVSISHKFTNEVKTFFLRPGMEGQLPIPIITKNNTLYFICEAMYINYYTQYDLLTNESKDLYKNIDVEDNFVILKFHMK